MCLTDLWREAAVSESAGEGEQIFEGDLASLKEIQG